MVLAFVIQLLYGKKIGKSKLQSMAKCDIDDYLGKPGMPSANSNGNPSNTDSSEYVLLLKEVWMQQWYKFTSSKQQSLCLCYSLSLSLRSSTSWLQNGHQNPGITSEFKVRNKGKRISVSLYLYSEDGHLPQSYQQNFFYM